MAAQGRGCAVAATLLLGLLVSGTQAVQYTVGDTNEWNLQVDYSTWAAQIKFKVGDTLLFKYNAEQHNVLQVSAADYSSCNSNNPITTWDDGKTVVTLSAATTYNFICGIPTHCSLGMKVAVSVLASSPAPTASNATPPATPPPVATPSVSTPPPATPPVSTPPPAAAPPVSPPTPVSTPVSAPLSSPPSASAPPPSHSSAPASSPTPSASSPTPSPASSPTPSPATPPSPSSSPTPAPASTPLSPSSPLPSISSPPPPSSTGPASAPASSDAYSSLAVHAITTVTSAAFVGVLLL